MTTIALKKTGTKPMQVHCTLKIKTPLEQILVIIVLIIEYKIVV